MTNTKLTLQEISTIMAKNPLTSREEQFRILADEEREREYVASFVSVSHWGLFHK